MGSFLLWPQARSACISHHGRIQATLPILTVSRHFHVQVGRGGNWAAQDKLLFLRLHLVRLCLPLSRLGGCIAQPHVCLCSVPGSHTRCPRDPWVGAIYSAPHSEHQPHPPGRWTGIHWETVHLEDFLATRLQNMKCPESGPHMSLSYSKYAGVRVRGEG